MVGDPTDDVVVVVPAVVVLETSLGETNISVDNDDDMADDVVGVGPPLMMMTTFPPSPLSSLLVS